MVVYPADLEETVRLRDGTEVFLRPVREDDGRLLEDLLEHMTPEDRRLRFFAPINRLSEALEYRLTHVDYEHAIALLAFAAGTTTLLGVVRLAAEAGVSRAEFAVALRSDAQGRGLGWLLMRRLPALAARLGVPEVVGYVLRDNARMLKMCRELGFAVEPSPEDPGQVVVRRLVPTA
jgi:acetyltransferase